MKNANRLTPRYHTLDELRGFAVLCMVFYHALYTLSYELNIFSAGVLFDFFTPLQPFFAAFFIILSGVCCSFSRSNIKRGLILGAISAAITLITAGLYRIGFIYSAIYFGILHLLSFSMILAGLILPFIKKLNIPFGIFITLALFAFGYNIGNGYLGFSFLQIPLPGALYQNNNLAFIGFYNFSFSSADYFPLIPWMFLFFTGVFIGFYEKKGRFPEFFKKRRVPFLSFLGTHSLLIYILHQPIIYFIFMFFKKIVGEI